MPSRIAKIEGAVATRRRMFAEGLLLLVALLPGASSFFLAPSDDCFHYCEAKRRCSMPLFAADNNNNNNDGILGLNEDGDFALVGINMNESSSSSVEPPASYLDRIMPQSPARNEIDERFLGLMSASGLSGGAAQTTTTTTTTHPSAITPPTINDSPTTAASTTSPPDNNPMDDDIDEIASLLQDIFPSLPKAEIQRYAMGLRNLGFDPACESRFYLTEDDLTFMKLLHRRCFVAEIVGHES